MKGVYNKLLIINRIYKINDIIFLHLHSVQVVGH